MTTIQYALATAIVLVVFVLVANVIVDLYARGAVRAAVDEAARTGARIDATVGDCTTRAHDVLGGLVGARLRGAVAVRCDEADGVVVARADVELPSWLALVPDWSFDVVGTAVKETAP
jgi:hypothetical protein